MRASFLAFVAAAALTAGALVPTPAISAMLGPAPALRSAADALTPFESVGCWAYGWRGWGWYPGILRCAAYGPPGYAAPAYVEAPPPPAYVEPGRCWVATDPSGQTGYWRRC